ncbi:sarcosine oxidase subunit gamma [Aestuariivirga sp.]|uniref:sarcosine oxidase subunit gamma n=1 Tax=Aestuariivirga sp. TaxID=2650926 RepID=UPI003593E468
MSELSYTSPLAGAAAPAGLSVSLREIPDRGMIDLRGLATDADFMAAVKSVLGVDLPTEPRTSVSWGDIKVLWLSIDQWLILSTRTKMHELLASLRGALLGIHSLAVDVSDMRVVIRIEGEGSREILMKGTSLDLLSGEYTPGTCRRMRFAEIAALLHVVEGEIFDIYVFRSYANYAWDFLLATAREPAKITLFGQQPAPV